MKPIFFMCLDMFIWLLLHGAKCNISQWYISSGEENITSWDEQKVASRFEGKCATARNLKITSFLDQFCLFAPTCKTFRKQLLVNDPLEWQQLWMKLICRKPSGLFWKRLIMIIQAVHTALLVSALFTH